MSVYNLIGKLFQASDKNGKIYTAICSSITRGKIIINFKNSNGWNMERDIISDSIALIDDIAVTEPVEETIVKQMFNGLEYMATNIKTDKPNNGYVFFDLYYKKDNRWVFIGNYNYESHVEVKRCLENFFVVRGYLIAIENRINK